MELRRGGGDKIPWIQTCFQMYLNGANFLTWVSQAVTYLMSLYPYPYP